MTDELTSAERASARETFLGKQGNVCVHCAGIHDTAVGLVRDRQPCERVKSATFHLDGTLLSVEYWPTGWDKNLAITRPTDAYEDDDVTDDTDGEAAPE